MTCLSDIDLATLHERRLEERFSYTLAWQGLAHEQHLHHHDQKRCQTKQEHDRSSEVYNSPHLNSRQQQQQHEKNRQNRQRQSRHEHYATKKQALLLAQNKMDFNGNCDKTQSNDKLSRGVITISELLRNRLEDDDNCNYFTSTTRRRRSGTWPHQELLVDAFPPESSLHLEEFNNSEQSNNNNNINNRTTNFLNKKLDEEHKVERLHHHQQQNHHQDVVGFEEFVEKVHPSQRILRRTRSLNAPSPFQQFGPCGRIMKNSAMVMQIQDPASQRLTWYKPPLTVLVIKKVSDSSVLAPFVQLVDWLVQEKNMVVWVESAVLDDPNLNCDETFKNLRDKLVTFKDGRDVLTDRIDFIICLGGDGTLLYASLLFQASVPPVMAFHLGSLGFLTPFRFDNFQEQVTNVLEGHAALTLRSRLRCIMHRKGDKRKDFSEPTIQPFFCDRLNHHQASTEQQQHQHHQQQHRQQSTSTSSATSTSSNQSNNMTAQQNLENSILVLNEVVIDRGPSPYLSNIDLFLDGKYITSVQGDGLIVSTPTGSTAYAVAAGASMIHPSVPAIMVTPICPHSLSFRPIVVPAGVELRISVSPDSRNTSWVSFDGRNRQELFHGDTLAVTTSIYPVPSICAQDQISDWFDSLADGLHWNVRKRQKCLDELSDLTASGSEDTLDEIENLKIYDI